VKSFIWVLGTSGVGKETLVRSMAADTNHPVAKLLALTKPAVSLTSIAIRGHQGRELLDLPSIFIQEFEEQGANELLIKWQGKDFENGNRIEDLRSARPNDKHVILYLTASLSTLQEHVHSRWPVETWREWDHDGDIKWCLDLTQNMLDNYELICLEVTPEGEYRLVDFPGNASGEKR